MSPQSTIAHYRITSKLGEGGMGEVYRAADTKLNRDVAIKVLPEIFAQDPERLARFTREAQVLASLNHPNIAAIYGVEERRAGDGAGGGRRRWPGALPLERRCRSRGRSPRRWSTRTKRASSIAISSRRTSRSRPTGA